MASLESQRIAKWYLGVISGTTAYAITYPLDVVKVQRQVLETRGEPASLTRALMEIIRRSDRGLTAVYNGVEAGILRQLGFQSARFAVYENAKYYMHTSGKPVGFGERVAFSALGGFLGGWLITPIDLVCVRIQTDLKLPVEQRRNYRNVFDGLFRVVRKEGLVETFRGSTLCMAKGSLMTIGQLATYDTVKEKILREQWLKEGQFCYIICSIVAGTCATFLNMPVDVIKSRVMHAKAGEFAGIRECSVHTFKEGGIRAFFKGFYPSFVRIAPATILTFAILEPLKKFFTPQPTISGTKPPGGRGIPRSNTVYIQEGLKLPNPAGKVVIKKDL